MRIKLHIKAVSQLNATNVSKGEYILAYATANADDGYEGYHNTDSDGNSYDYIGSFKFDVSDSFTGFADITATVEKTSCIRNSKISSIGVEVENGGINVLEVKPGDPDGDGEITVADALAALRAAARLSEVTPELLATCDVDKDGWITVADALAILRVAAKLTDEF